MHIDKRIAICPKCSGLGKITKSAPHGEEDVKTCDECKGTGRLVVTLTFKSFTEEVE
jgi:DnaJ-class molecular chaperone